MKKILPLVLCACACSSPPAKAPAVTAPAKPAASAPPPVDKEPWRNQLPTPGPRAELAYPVPEVVRLTNGLTLYVMRRPAELVELEFVIRHGASSVANGKSGLAALTARMLTEGTRNKSSLELAEAVESLGSSLDADAGRDESHLSLSCLHGDLSRALALLAEVVQSPAFSPKEFERVRAEWLDGLLAERQEPQHLASLVGLRALLGPLTGAPVSGSVPDVKALEVRDLADFHQQHYVPEDAALILVGDLELAAAKSQVEKLFGKWRARGKPAPVPLDLPAEQGSRVLLVDRPGAVQTALFVAQQFPPRNTAGHEAREILSNLLGGLFTSRINQNLREKHAYTYGARTSLVATRRWGAFAVSTSVKTAVTAPALVEVARELQALRSPNPTAPITTAELERAKSDLIHHLGAHLEHTSRVAGDLAVSFVEGLPTDYASRYAPLIESLSADAVAQESSRLLPDKLVIVAVGDRKLIEPELKARGFAVTTAAPKLLE